MSPRHTPVATLSICFCLVFPACMFLLGTMPQGCGAAFLALALIPLSLACPVVAGGCALHDLLERRNPRMAKAIAVMGILLFWLLASVLVWLRLS